MDDNESWRHSHIGHLVFKIFDGDEVTRLEERIERVGFRNDNMKSLMPQLIREWAFFWLNQEDANYRGQKYLGREHADLKLDEVATPSQWKGVKQIAKKLRESMEMLPPATRRFLVEFLTDEPNAASEDILRSWPGGRNPLAQLCLTLQRVEAASPPLKRRGRPPKSHTPAVKARAPIWTALTGQPAKSPYNTADGAYTSPFNEFATEAAMALYQDVRSVDGILKKRRPRPGRT